MMKRLKIFLIALAVASVALLNANCKSPAGPTVAPPAELPSPVVLKFVEPEQLRIDFSTIGTKTLSISADKAVGAGGEFSGIISGAEIVIDFFDQLFEAVLRHISQIDIPQGVETFHETVIFSDELGALGGEHDVKLDFRQADMDIDGDGVVDPYAGNSSTVPACIMFWLDDERYSVWRIVEPISADGTTIGEGFFKLYFTDGEGDVGLSFAISYKQTEAAPAQKDVEYYLYAEELSSDFDQGYHILAQEQGPAANAYKNLKIDWFLNAPLDSYVTQYVGRFVEGFDLWSGSLISNSKNELDVCARISDGEDAGDPTLCEDVNGFDLRDGNAAFIDALELDDVAIPLEFTATPTF